MMMYQLRSDKRSSSSAVPLSSKIYLSDLKEKYKKWNWYGATERPRSRNSFPALKDAKVPVGVFMRDLWLALRANGLEKLAIKIEQSLEDIWLNDEEPQDSMAMKIEFGAPLDPIKSVPPSFSADIIPGLYEFYVHLTVWTLFWQVVTHGELWAAHISGTAEELGCSLPMVRQKLVYQMTVKSG